MSRPAFSGAALTIFITAGLVFFALSFQPSAPGPKDYDPHGPNRAGTHSYSASALGHAGFYELLKRLGRPVARNLADSPEPAHRGAVIVAEPEESLAQGPEPPWLKARRLLVVLPKRDGIPDPKRPAWLKQTWLNPRNRADGVLNLVLRQAGARTQRLPWPRAWTVNDLGFQPTGPEPAQLLRSSGLRPVVAVPEGLLVGVLEKPDQTIWVLADPDLMANHGLGRGENAAFMLALADLVRGDSKTSLIFEETVHGFRLLEGSLLDLLLRWPHRLIIILLGAAAALAVWAGAGRFGAPLRLRRELDFGKAGLIANGARLLDYAGRPAEVLRRHLRQTLRSAGRTLNAPRGLDETSLAAWLDRLGRARGLDCSGAAILKSALAVRGEGESRAEELDRLQAGARSLHRWKEGLAAGRARPLQPSPDGKEIKKWT